MKSTFEKELKGKEHLHQFDNHILKLFDLKDVLKARDKAKKAILKAIVNDNNINIDYHHIKKIVDDNL